MLWVDLLEKAVSQLEEAKEHLGQEYQVEQTVSARSWTKGMNGMFREQLKGLDGQSWVREKRGGAEVEDIKESHNML